MRAKGAMVLPDCVFESSTATSPRHAEVTDNEFAGTSPRRHIS